MCRIFIGLALGFFVSSGCFAMQRCGTSFYIIKPVDEYWNAGMGRVIIEATEEIDEHWYQKALDAGVEEERAANAYTTLNVIAPENFSWKRVKKGLFIECPEDGPARYLSYEEWFELVHRLRPDIPLPK